MLFLLAFVQQITLLILLFYWEPTKPSNDSKSYYIDFIFFIFYAICDNLWMAHNLSKKFNVSSYIRVKIRLIICEFNREPIGKVAQTREIAMRSSHLRLLDFLSRCIVRLCNEHLLLFSHQTLPVDLLSRCV